MILCFFKVLYCALVRPSLKYGTILWNPKQMYLISKLKKVQKNCLRLYAFKTKMLSHNINKVANFASLKSMKTKRLIFDVTFIYEMLNGESNSPKWLQRISLKVFSFNFWHISDNVTSVH